MRISLKSLFVTAAFGFIVVGCAPATGGDDGGAPECASDTDCEGSLQCHPGLGICVEDCSLEESAACPAEAPVCNEADDNGDYPLELEDADADQAFRLLCICVVDGDCGAGEVCDADTRECVAGDAGDAGPGEDECTIATEVADCGADAFCIDGACEAACVDSDCIPTGDLCLYDDTDAEFNQCVLADEVTNTCTEGDGAPVQGGADIIVISFVETLTETEGGCDVAGSTFLRSYWADVYSEADLTADDAQDLVFRPGFAAGNEKFFEADPALTEIVDLADGDYGVTVWICGGATSPASAAIQVSTADSDSNTYCFDPLIDPT